MKRKLDIIKSKQSDKGTVKIEVDQSKQLEKLDKLEETVKSLWHLLNDKKEFDPDAFTSQLKQIADAIDIKDQMVELKAALKIPENKPIDLSPVIKAIKENKPKEYDFTKFEKAIIEIQQRVQQGSPEPEQAPEGFQPVRRVVKIGNRLVFDDQATPANIRGGGGGGGSSSGGLTDAELRASPVPVEATIDTTGLATDTGQDEQTALLTTIDASLNDIETAVEILDNTVAGSEMQVDVVGALPAGNNNIGDVDVASIATGTNLIGQVNVAPQTANGLSVFNATSSDGSTALTATAQVIKATAGQLYGWYIYNPNATAQFVQLYNVAAASVTVGTTNPLFMLTIPATAGANVEFTNGITFSNAGWSCAATSTAGGNGAPGTALDAVFFYK